MRDDHSETEMGDAGVERTVPSSHAVSRRQRLVDFTPERELASGGRTDPRMGSVFHRSVSPVQNLRFRNPTVDGINSLFPNDGPVGAFARFHGEMEHRTSMGGK